MAKLRTLKDVVDGGLDMIAICHSVSCRYTKPVDLTALVRAVGEMASLLPTKGQEHFSERMRCPQCKHRGMFLWLDTPRQPNPHISSSLVFRVVEEDRLGRRGMTEIVRAADRQTAQAAYEVAEAIYPQSQIELHWQRQILESSHLKAVKGKKTG